MTYTEFSAELNDYIPYNSDRSSFAEPMSGGVLFTGSARGVILTEQLAFPFKTEDIIEVKHRMEENLQCIIVF
jgi:hypothetical protein